MLGYMEKMFGERATAGDKSVLAALRAEAERLQNLHVNTPSTVHADIIGSSKGTEGL